MISTQPSIAVIWTGTHVGKVGVTVEWRQDEPELSLDEWDEVAETAMPFEHGTAMIFGSVPEESTTVPPLPAGSYRLRIHTRGRDVGHEKWIVEAEPVEEHLVIAWPVKHLGESMRHKSTDVFGAMVRETIRRR